MLVRNVSISSPDQPCMMPLLKSMVRMKSRVSCLSKDRLYVIKKRIADIILQNRGKLMAAPPGSWAWWKVLMNCRSGVVHTGVISKEKKVASSCEIAGKFRWPPALFENPTPLCHKPDF